MDSKLVEEIEARIEFIKLALKHCGKCEDETCSACGFYETELGILKRCLESLRWKYSPEEPTETGDYLVETEDEHGDKGFEIMRYKISKAFGNKWEFLGSGYTLVRWLPIPQ